MIKNLPFYHLRVDEYHTLSLQVVSLLKKQTLEDPQLNVMHTKIQEAIDKFDKAYLKPGSKLMTITVKEADDNRDKKFKAFRFLVEACWFRNKQEWNDDPALVMETLRLYGWTLYADSYAIETSRLNKMINAIDESAELTAAVTNIGAKEWYDELKQSQKDFETVYEARNAKNASAPDIKTEDAIVQLRQYFQVLFKYVESMAEMGTNPVYVNICNEINEMIAPLQTAVNLRKKKPEDIVN
ncbi:MAG: DUF6261 family protein [Marinifilum sp.]|jgi:hypothetical protein|nr:DUF6261 family protein [Marinifilum sp.]